MKLFIALLLALAAQAGLAAYPERPITLIVAYPPGGGTDLIARALAPYVEKNLGGAKIVIVNRAGAGGEVGFAALAAARPTATPSASSTRRRCSRFRSSARPSSPGSASTTSATSSTTPAISRSTATPT
jgi:tripartite-type tricarboxylate transporter receptor subunit TctC